MRGACAVLVRHSATVLALAIFIGLLAPPLAAMVRPAITPIIAGLLFTAMLRIPPGRVSRDRPGLIGWVVLWLLIANPLLAAGVTKALMIPDAQRLPIVLMCAVPPILSAPSMALLLRLDAALMLGIVMVVSLLCPITLALVPGLLVDLPAGVDPLTLFGRFAALIGGAFAAATIVRRVAGTARLRSFDPEIDALGLLLMVLFAVGIMDGVTRTLMDRPSHVLAAALTMFALNLILQALGAIAFAPFGRRVAATVGFASGNRNMGLWIAALPLGAAGEIMLYIAVAQFPVYLLPRLLAPLYARLTAVSAAPPG